MGDEGLRRLAMKRSLTSFHCHCPEIDVPLGVVFSRLRKKLAYFVSTALIQALETRVVHIHVHQGLLHQRLSNTNIIQLSLEPTGEKYNFFPKSVLNF